MNGSLLSWDSLEEDAKQPELVRKAAASLANMDDSAGKQELLEQEQAIAARKEIKEQKLAQVAAAPDVVVMQSAQAASPVQLGMLNEAMRKRIEASLAEVPNIVGTGGRLKVSEKFLLNCDTDLNQLIPFKYGWAWSSYLTSCDKHWMPTEINWINDIAKFKVMTTSSKKIIMRTVINYMYSKYVYPNDLLMSIYRHVTNPECRQYILRLSFEECCLNHTMRHWEEIFDLGAEVLPNNGGLLKTSIKVDEDTFKERNMYAAQFTKPLMAAETSTKGTYNTREFLKNLTVLFGGVKYLGQITQWFQIVKLARQERLEGFEKNAEYVLRDLNRQLDFSVNFISTALEENPEAFDNVFAGEVNAALTKLVNYELDFISTLAVDENDYAEMRSILPFLKNRYMNKLGIPTPPVVLDPKAHWFIDYLDSAAISPKANHDVTISSTAGTGGLDFGD